MRWPARPDFWFALLAQAAPAQAAPAQAAPAQAAPARAAPPRAEAAAPDGAPATPWIDPSGVPGTRIVAGGGRLPASVLARFVELAGGEGASGDGARIVLIPTATARAGEAQWCEGLRQRWQEDFSAAEFTVLHAADRAHADSEELCAPLAQATGVWFGGGAQERIAATYLGTRVERALCELLARGGVVGGTSAGAAVQSRTMIQESEADDRDRPVLAQGFDLVPGAIVDQHFLARRRLPRLEAALRMRPGHFGLGVDERTAVEIAGRRMRVLGEGKALLVLPPGGGRERRVVELGAGLPAGTRADLVCWQRAARDRARPPWPPVPMAPARLAAGALVIVGGGRIPAAVVERFVALAGGASARVVIVPTALGRVPAGREEPFARALRAAGVADVRTFHCAHPSEVTAERLAVLADATAVWFGGGRQWRLCDAYDGTPAVAAFRAVLARGGVIGGTSAGATIQGEFLVRGNPLGNREEWCEGYDRGFGFLPGCAIDQHFVARGRTADLQGLVAALPQLIGLGVDEGTAAVVQGSALEVVGESRVAVFDVRAAEPRPERPEPVWLAPGEQWDLVGGRAMGR